MLENKNKTEISGLGEFGLIKVISDSVTIKNKSTIKGIGDDAAVIDYGGKQMLISTDLLIENVHFDMVYTPLKHLGYKAAAVNFSDIAAMNALPRQITVSIALSSKYPLEAVEELYAGINMACDRYSVDLVGGDTTSSLSGLLISVTVVGDALPEQIVYRNTAKVNDLICVSGDLGAAYIGLQILEREKAVYKANPEMQPDLEGNDYVLERFLKPEPRTDIVKLLKEIKVKPTAMIDISDGLASEILHITNDSDVGCCLYEEKIPLDALTEQGAQEFNLDPTTCALNGGEDYELLFTIDAGDYEKIKTIPNIAVIGHITEKREGKNIVTKNGTFVELKALGWDGLK